MKNESLNPVDCPYYLITRASLAMTSVMKRDFTSSGYGDVKPAYLGVLMCLWMEDCMGETLAKFGKDEGMKLTDLAKCAGLEPSSMTGLIDRMEKDGLVYRGDDPNDRRVNIIRLTERGASIREAVIGIVNTMIKGAFTGIPEERMNTAKDVIRAVLNNASRGGSHE